MVNNAKLIELMKAHVEGGTGKETYLAFLTQLTQSWLLVPTPELLKSDPATGKTTVPMYAQRTANGEKILPVYTDDESFNKYTKAPAIAELRCIDIFGLALQTGIDHVVVNAGDPNAVAVSKKYFLELSRGVVPLLD